MANPSFTGRYEIKLRSVGQREYLRAYCDLVNLILSVFRKG